MTDAAMASHTPIDVFMGMTIRMFYEFVSAIRSVIEAQRRKA